MNSFARSGVVHPSGGATRVVLMGWARREWEGMAIVTDETAAAADSEHGSPLAMDGARFRELGHRVVDQIAAFLDHLPERAVAPDVTVAEIRRQLGGNGVPESGADPAELLDRALALLENYNRLTPHPRQWGYIIGSAAPIGALADLIAAAVNPNVVSWPSAPMATELETQAVRWVADLLGYPRDGGGLMVSGGNAANFVGFFAARRAKAGWAVRDNGMEDGAARRLRAYVSKETHTWVEKAADLSGLGTGAIRWVETDRHQRVDPVALERQIEQDCDSGLAPFLVVGSAGTVSTGAVDPLPELAAIARRHGLWFHVDGAYGAPAVLAEGTPADLRGLAQADSLAVDPHKWLYVPLEAGCALVRDRRHLTDAFSYHPPYYHAQAGQTEELVNFHEMGPQNSRGLRALKVWLVLQQAGRMGLRRLIEHDIALAEALWRCMHESPDFEALTRGLSITTFRYVPPDLRGYAPAEPYLDELNRALMGDIQRSGEAYLSNAVIGQRFALRTCITNFRTRREDVLALPDIIRPLGRSRDASMRPATLRRGSAH